VIKLGSVSSLKLIFAPDPWASLQRQLDGEQYEKSTAKTEQVQQNQHA
jgi:hypothetical protein